MSRRTTATSRRKPTEGTVTVSVRLTAHSRALLRMAAARKGVGMGALLADLWERSPEAQAEAKLQRVDRHGR